MRTASSVWSCMVSLSVLLFLASVASAGPDPGEVIGRTATFTGDQRDGIMIGTDYDHPGVTWLNVYGLDGSITPVVFSQGGLYFWNEGGDGVTIMSGEAQDRVVIETNTSYGSGILGFSKGAPSGYRQLPVLGLIVPTGPAGPLNIVSHSDITTYKFYSSGIKAEKWFGNYNAASIASLLAFNPDAVTLRVVDPVIPPPPGDLIIVSSLTANNVSTPRAGDNGGLFTLSADGAWDFELAGMDDLLRPGEWRVTRLNYQVSETVGASSRLVTGTIAVRVVKSEDGSIRTVPTIYFTEYDTYSDPTSKHALWPDHRAYVDRLLGSMGTPGGAESLSVANHGTITTYDKLSWGIYTNTIGVDGTAGRNASLGTPPTAGGTGSGGGSTLVTNEGRVFTSGLEAGGIFAWSLAGSGGKGGDGGTWYGGRIGGVGGTGGDVRIAGAGDVRTDGGRASAITARSHGGDGGDGGSASVVDAGRGGQGGKGGEISVEGSGNIATTGQFSSGILAISQGGLGGAGGEGNFASDGTRGGQGGKGGEVNVEGSWAIATGGAKAHGIWAKSVGGTAGSGGTGGWLFAKPGAGGAASDGGDVSVTSGGGVTTRGEDSFGIYGQSVGGFGGSGGTAVGLYRSFGGDGGSAGSGGDVTIFNQAGGSVGTEGIRAHALFGQSIGGGGGSGGGEFNSVVSLGGSGGAGGYGGTVIIGNEGEAATRGDFARGISAQSIGGGGGDGNFAAGLISIGGEAGEGSDGGEAMIGNLGGAVRTAGNYADGLYAQSIGGGGGSGGWSAGLVSIGGDGGGGGAGGYVYIENSGHVGTEGIRSRGLFAQSVGGGGGDGAGAGGIVSLGGSGEGGGSGGSVVLHSEGGVETRGEDSSALHAQSVGGGGGSGAWSGGTAVSVGGSGGGAGHGGFISVNNKGIATTEGDRSYALFAQSTGGGGGSSSISGAVNVSLGGSGGSAGDGGMVRVRNSGSMGTLGQDASALFAQSVGGGGGSAIASGAYLVSLGGDGGSSGSGGDVSVLNEGEITTAGDRSHSIFAESLGGGGGRGGGTGAVYAIGGSGGSSGDGGFVGVYNDGALNTGGADASAIHAESIGGSGGSGGGAGAINMAIGGSGGSAGDGGMVWVDNTAAITTTGRGSHSIYAASTGGGGGNAATSGAAVFSLGGKGGAAGHGGDVGVLSSSNLTVSGENAGGIFAQSVGGGGGSGGNVNNLSVAANFALTMGIGGDGSGGGSGGRVEVLSGSHIETSGNQGAGIFAQSIGGGGGNAGNSLVLSATGDVVQKIPIAINVGASIGGDGGVAGDGGAVDVTSAGQIRTAGFQSHGIWAQSLGGGGGSGGDSNRISLSYNVDLSATWAVGGDGGAAGHGGDIAVTGSNAIRTAGDFSFGIFAQSLGGGGGTGANSLTLSGNLNVPTGTAADFAPSFTYNKRIGGDAGAAGDGGNVDVAISGSVQTQGKFSYGLLAQSVGGGGGVGGSTTDIPLQINAEEFDPDPSKKLLGELLRINMDQTIGGDGGAAGDGGTVRVTSTDAVDIVTSGAFAVGILAQSVGGGGGAGGNALSFEFFDGDSPVSVIPYLDQIGESTNFSMVLEGSGGGGGSGKNVAVVTESHIKTQGAFAHGILAQSVGGGGGFSGISETYNLSTLRFGSNAQGKMVEVQGEGASFSGSVGGAGAGGIVSVEHTGNILTQGHSAAGIFAQSAGGVDSRGGRVYVTFDGNIMVQGPDGDGILAQSSGGAEGSDIGVYIHGGTVQGGSGNAAGVRLVGGADNHIGNYGLITTREGAQGLAIAGAGGRGVNVNNYGVVTGSVVLEGLGNAFNNAPGAVLNAGSTIELGAESTLRSAGVLSPGGAGNVVTTGLTGNLVQEAGGRFRVDVDLDSHAADRIDVSGTAKLAGQLEVAPVSAGLAAPGTQQAVILASIGGVTNSDLNLVSSSAVTRHKLFFPNDNEIHLASTLDYAPQAMGLDFNQQQVGDLVNRIQLAGGSDAFAPVAAQLVTLPDGKSLGDAYTHLGPGLHQASIPAAVNASRQYAGTLIKRTHSIRSYLDAYGQAPGFHQTDPRGGWFIGLGRDATQDPEDGLLGHKLRLRGASLGLDFLSAKGFLGGLGFGRSDSTLTFDNDMGRSDITSTFGSLYGSWFSKSAYLDGAVAYGRQSFESSRHIRVGELTQTARGDYGGDLYFAFVQSGMNRGLGNWLFQPFAGLQFSHLRQESHQESGAEGVNLQIDSRSSNSLLSDLGLRIARPFKKSNLLIIPEAQLAWRHDFDIDDGLTTASFDDFPAMTFKTNGPKGNLNSAIVEFGLTCQTMGGLSFQVNYSAELGSSYNGHQLSGEIRFEF